MSNVYKSTSKKYYTKNAPKRNFSMDVGFKGFLCSCNFNEKMCIRESYNILNLYADKLHPSEPIPASSTEPEIEDSLAKEIAELKEEKTKDRKFQVIESGAKNFLFIRTTVEDPVELAKTIIEDIHQTKNQQTRFLLRLIPIEVTCRANVEDIGKAFAPLAEKHFKDSALTFSILFSHRNNNSLSKDAVIKVIADMVSAVRSDHKVDLKGAQVTIIVEAIKGFAFLGVVPDYFKYKKYNLLSNSDDPEKKDVAPQSQE